MGNPGEIDPESIRIEDSIYSAKKLADIHPGGHLFIRVSIDCVIMLHHYL